MKKLLFTAALLITASAQAQVPIDDPAKFPDGIMLPNIVELATPDSLMAVDGEGNVMYTHKDSLATKLNIGYGLSMVNDTLVSGVIKDTVFADTYNLRFNMYPDSTGVGTKYHNFDGGLEGYSGYYITDNMGRMPVLGISAKDYHSIELSITPVDTVLTIGNKSTGKESYIELRDGRVLLEGDISIPTISSKMNYDIDYSTVYNDRSLVDREYVQQQDSQTISITDGNIDNAINILENTIPFEKNLNNGFFIRGRNEANYGDPFGMAFDLSESTITSDTLGATGRRSFAAGLNVEASGVGAFAMGDGAEASGDGAFAFGANTTASGERSFSGGFNTEASGVGSFAMGDGAEATGDEAFAFGEGAEATGDGAFAFGSPNGAFPNDRTVATNSGDFAFGYGTKAAGGNSFAFGFSAETNGLSTIAMGHGATAVGERSVALQGTATGVTSLAVGVSSVTEGDQSTALGYGAQALSFREIALGTTATTGYIPESTTDWVATDRIFTVGAGNYSNPYNVIEILKNGTITAPSLDLAEIVDPKSLTTKEYVDQALTVLPSLHEQTITVSELTNSGTTPVDLIPDPGAGKIVVIEKIVGFMEAGTTPYDDDGLAIKYGNGVPLVTFSVPFNEGGNDIYEQQEPGGNLQPNQPIQIGFNVDPTQGDAILHLKIYYRIEEL